VPRREQLELIGYRDLRVPNTLLRQDGQASRVGIFFPGFGYTCEMPLFYYSTALLWEVGADVLRVEYAYHLQPDFRDLSASEQRAWLLADTAAALDAVSQQSHYREIILIGKSLGTRAMGYHLTVKPPHQAVRAVWLTPLLRDPDLRQQMRAVVAPSLTIIGTADSHYDADDLDAIAAEPAQTIVTVAGGNHGLDLASDVAGSIRTMETVIEGIRDFVTLEFDRSQN
jgi:predicted alpha/beta-hydrolase family hydrolase